jgi:hypothetical protein
LGQCNGETLSTQQIRGLSAGLASEVVSRVGGQQSRTAQSSVALSVAPLLPVEEEEEDTPLLVS